MLSLPIDLRVGPVEAFKVTGDPFSTFNLLPVGPAEEFRAFHSGAPQGSI